MSTENLTTYTDFGGFKTVTASRVTWAALPRDVDAYTYDDKGIGHFSGNFEHLFDIFQDTLTQDNSVAIPYCLANVIDDSRGMIDNSNDAIVCWINPSSVNNRFFLYEFDAGTLYQDTYQVPRTATWTLYLKIIRDESVGTYGTIYAFIYSDSARTILLDTLVVALHTSKKDFRYVYAAQSYNSGTTQLAYGYTENLDLQEAISTRKIKMMRLLNG